MAIVLDGSNLTTTGVLNSKTAVASTSGTSIDFNSIPAGTKRITVMMNGVSTNGSSNFQMQIGNGSIVSSGYSSQSSNVQSSIAVITATSGYIIYAGNAANTITGHLVLTLQQGNTWVASHVLASVANNFSVIGSGAISLGSTLDRVRITTVNGTDTFDAGSINILYE